MSIEWYAVHTYVGHEEKVRTNMMQARPFAWHRRLDLSGHCTF